MHSLHAIDLAASSEHEHCQSILPTQGIGGVVLGGDYQGLGVARSLGRRGVPVCVIDDEYSIARYSRYVTHSVRVPDLRDEQKTIAVILDSGRRLGLEGWVLYPTRDETVAAISRHRSVLSEYFRVPTPTWSTVQHIWDKRNTYNLAGELNIPIPRTRFSREPEDFRQVNGSFPVAIKPAIKEHFFYATKAKAWRADNREELLNRFQQASKLLSPAEIMVQDVVPGNGSHQFAYCGFFKEGKPVASMVVQRSRQHPPEFGRASTFVRSVEMPELEVLAERFLRAIDYYGLVEVEFKLDPRDNEYKLLDVNARTWGYHTLGAAAGVDFSYLLFADQLGEQLEPVRARPGVTWVRLLTDLPGSIMQVAGRQLRFAAYVKSIFRSNAEAVFCLDDPVPGLAEIALFPYLIYKRGF
jgi:predicted ATP-grasp superfamily ATP-dependent carboligase